VGAGPRLGTSKRAVILRHPQGLHARPATLFVEMAQKFNSEATITLSGAEANAKSILSVLTLGAEMGSEVVIHAIGEDAQVAVSALVAMIESDFGEKTGPGPDNAR
jgi:phosphocarrier protein HPr